MKKAIAILFLLLNLFSLRSEPTGQKKADFDRVESFALGNAYQDVYHALLKKYDAGQVERRRWSFDGVEQGRAILLLDRQASKSVDFDFLEDKLIFLTFIHLSPDGFEEAERLRKEWTELYGPPEISPAKETAGAEPVLWVARWTQGNVQRFLSPFMVDWKRRGVSYGVKRADLIDEGPHTINYY